MRFDGRAGHGSDAVFPGSLIARLFIDTDASWWEINPCVVTGDGKLVALDARRSRSMTTPCSATRICANCAIWMRKTRWKWKPRIRPELHQADGTVACTAMCWSAMATMDIIKYTGGSPANFLDVGGGATADQVKNAFHILLSDPEVRAVFINIFGGILRCDVLATGVVAAAKDLHVKIPIVVRMEGTNVERGQQILRESGLNFTIADGMKDGAQKVVALAGGAR